MESAELQSVAEFGMMLQIALEDATSRLGVDVTGLEVISFRQTWPDASWGFDGIAAQVLTDAQTVVVSAPDGSSAALYAHGAFAYLVERPNSTFWDAVRAHQLPGAAADHSHLGD